MGVPRFRSSGDHPFSCWSLTHWLDSPSLCSLNLAGSMSGITRLWSFGDSPVLLESHPLVRLSLVVGCSPRSAISPFMLTECFQALILWQTPFRRWGLGITRLWPSGNDLTPVGVSPTGSTLSCCWLIPRLPLKYPSAIQHPGRVPPSPSVLLGAPSTVAFRLPWVFLLRPLALVL